MTRHSALFSVHIVPAPLSRSSLQHCAPIAPILVEVLHFDFCLYLRLLDTGLEDVYFLLVRGIFRLLLTERCFYPLENLTVILWHR